MYQQVQADLPDYVTGSVQLVQPWAALESEGYVELTRQPLPRQRPDVTDASIRVRAKTGLTFQAPFRHSERLRLPECAYIPHVEPVLKAEGEYPSWKPTGCSFHPKAKPGYHAPVATTACFAFARDPDCSKQVERRRRLSRRPVVQEFGDGI